MADMICFLSSPCWYSLVKCMFSEGGGILAIGFGDLRICSIVSIYGGDACMDGNIEGLARNMGGEVVGREQHHDDGKVAMGATTSG